MANETTWNGIEDSIGDPEEERVLCLALDSFMQYAKVAHFHCTHLRRQAFYALPRSHQQILMDREFQYLDTLNRVDDAIQSNAELARLVARFGLISFRMSGSPPGEEPTMPEQWLEKAPFSDVDKARSTLRQFYRDWSAEGMAEREACYGPVKLALAGEQARRREGHVPLKVLVPGAGLGRLVFDLCHQGYEAEGNEISYHQLLASSYILNCTERAGQHTIYPWIHTFSNHRSRDRQMRGYKIPDIHPATALAEAPGAGSMSMCAADFLCLYEDSDHQEQYDAVACVFFLDTAPNLIRYLEVIHGCLRPGGVLINIGPLQWHFENNAPGTDHDGEHDPSTLSGITEPGSFELTDDEVMGLVQRMGFVVEKEETGLDTPYIQDTESMMQLKYRASHWVARKPVK